jgi:hypothetical protein
MSFISVEFYWEAVLSPTELRAKFITNEVTKCLHVKWSLNLIEYNKNRNDWKVSNEIHECQILPALELFLAFRPNRGTS